MISRICHLIKMKQPEMNRGLLFASGTVVPEGGTDGYQTGCIFQHTDGIAGETVYINNGSVTECDFSNPEGGDTLTLAELADVADGFATRILETGTYASTASAGVVFSATNKRPFSLLFDDGGAALTVNDYRGILSRVLLSVDQTTGLTVNSIRGQIKLNNLVDNTSADSVLAPLTGYLELDGVGARTLNGRVACVRAALEEGASGTTTVGTYLAGFEATLHSTRTYAGAGLTAAFLADIHGGTSKWQYGLYIEDASCLTGGVYVSGVTTGVTLAGAMTTGLSIAATGLTDGIKVSGTTPVDGIEVSSVCSAAALHVSGASAVGLSVSGICTTGVNFSGATVQSHVAHLSKWGESLNYGAVTVAGDEAGTALAWGSATGNVCIQRINMTAQIGTASGYVMGTYQSLETSGAGAGTVLTHGIWIGNYSKLTIAHNTTDAYATRGRTVLSGAIAGNQFVGVMGNIEITAAATLEASGGTYGVYGSIAATGSGTCNQQVAAGYFTLRGNTVNLAGEMSCVVADFGGAGCYADYLYLARCGNNNLSSAAIGIRTTDAAIMPAAIELDGSSTGGQSYINHVLAFQSSSQYDGAKVATITFDGTADGMFKIDVAGTSYYVPFWDAAGIDNDWANYS